MSDKKNILEETYELTEKNIHFKFTDDSYEILDDSFNKDGDEQWKDIIGYEGYYQVSNKGRVRSLDRTIQSGNGFRRYFGKLMTLSYSTYRNVSLTPTVGLSKDGNNGHYSVNQLVLNTFIIHPRDQKKLIHKNGDVQDCDFENILYMSINEYEDKYSIKISKDNRYPLEFKGKLYDENNIDDLFDIHYSFRGMIRVDGGVYMHDGLVRFPDGSSIDERSE